MPIVARVNENGQVEMGSSKSYSESGEPDSGLTTYPDAAAAVKAFRSMITRGITSKTTAGVHGPN